MSSLKLNSIKTCFFCQSHALSKFTFCCFNLFKSHLMRYGRLLTSKISHFLAATDCWRCPNLKSSYLLVVSGSACVIDLDKYSSIVGMDLISHFFPTLSLFLGEKISRTSRWPSSLTPSHCFSKDDSSSSSLSIVFSNHIIGNTIVSASLTS